jgi:hypothetical protein
MDGNPMPFDWVARYKDGTVKRQKFMHPDLAYNSSMDTAQVKTYLIQKGDGIDCGSMWRIGSSSSMAAGGVLIAMAKSLSWPRPLNQTMAGADAELDCAVARPGSPKNSLNRP